MQLEFNGRQVSQRAVGSGLDAKEEYTLITEILYRNNGEYRPYGEFNLTLSATDNSFELLQTVITDLNGISPTTKEDAQRIAEAIKELSTVRPDVESKDDAEKNIDKILHAIEHIQKLTFDVSSIRLKLDELLKIWEKKWYLMDSEN